MEIVSYISRTDKRAQLATELAALYYLQLIVPLVLSTSTLELLRGQDRVIL